MEKRREYDEGDVITCPKCDSANVDYEQAPEQAVCEDCGLKFRLRTVAVWDE